MRAPWTAFWIASAFFLFEFIARVEPGLAASSIGHFYKLTNRGFGSLASLFFWVYAPMQILVGVLLDRFGARRLILPASLACAAGIFLFAGTDDLIIGEIGRVLTGFGASFAFVSALWLVNHWFASDRFASLSGAVNAVGMFGTAASAVALSSVMDRLSWQAVFMMTAAAGLALFVVALCFLRDPPLRSAATSPDAAAGMAQNLAAVLRTPRTWTISIVSLLFYMPLNVYGGLWGTTELTADHQLSPLAAQTAVSMIFLGMAAGSVAGGWLSDRLGHRKFVVLVGALVTGLAYAAVLYLPGTSLSISALLLAAGFFGGFQMLTFAMAKEGHDNCVAGTVIAFVNMIGITGAMIFQPFVGYLADLTNGDYRLALTTVPLCAALAALIVLFLPEYRHPDHLSGTRAAERTMPSKR